MWQTHIANTGLKDNRQAAEGAAADFTLIEMSVINA